MKIKFLSILFLGSMTLSLPACNLLLEYEEPRVLCTGNIIFDTHVYPDLCLYYNGNQLQLDVHQDKLSKKLGTQTTKKELLKIVPYSLYQAKAIQRFHILICLRPQFASDFNTVTYVHVPETISYKFYTLVAARKYNDNNEVDGCMWTVTEEALSPDRIVPDNTIIFLFNADYIENLETKSWPLNSNMRLLPNIIMKKTVQPEDIARTIIEARMIAIDFDTIHHHHEKSMNKIENKTIVTIKP